MLFRTKDGKLIEINKKDFKNDKLYYQKIMSLFSNNEKLEMIYREMKPSSMDQDYQSSEFKVFIDSLAVGIENK